ncbi:tandem-type lipoprotein [Staphylococcus epidermidis]|uniref:tandem-type lipoprotein n=1 Tax=Staphylococcus epidermidis TaxID=1282 RepID=UPI0021B49C4D|nr:tandem-type lipoprotein [Staphylococcus epidermidis]
MCYNGKVASYWGEYDLSNEDHNLKHLTKTYNIPTNKPPKLILKPHPNLKPSSIPHKHLHLSFLTNKQQTIYFPHTLQFNPTHLNNHFN